MNLLRKVFFKINYLEYLNKFDLLAYLKISYKIQNIVIRKVLSQIKNLFLHLYHFSKT